jgi:predicted metal-dependent phosphoesterase TrpH
VFDLHLHSLYSDGTLPVAGVVAALAQRGVKGFSLTDHNGLWGAQEASESAEKHNLIFIPGLEISALEGGTAIHLLAYGKHMDEAVLSELLEPIRVGYEERIRQMAGKCREAGYPLVSAENILERRLAQQKNPVLISTDIAAELRALYHLDPIQARALTTVGGACYVPYGSWAPAIARVTDVVHRAGGIVSLAHPGLIALDESAERMQAILSLAADAGIDAVEVYHPAHTHAMTDMLERFCLERHLLVTGGSDWHGPQQSWNTLGQTGMSDEQAAKILDKLN